LWLMPEIRAPRETRNPALKGLRVCPVKDFEDFLIFDLANGDAVRIIRILHGKRDLIRILTKESAADDALH
jgi:plasmid stabilization system protein ParE